MTPKYSTGQDGGDRWESDVRHVVATWSSKPFVGASHRYETVEQRLVVEYTHGVGVEIRYEARSTDSAKLSDDWSPVETIEVRDYGARHDRRPEARWLD